MKTIIAIDPGTKCGWAVRLPNGDITSGTFNLSPKRHESSGMRFVNFRTSFLNLIKSNNDMIVAYEEVRRHAGTDAAHIYGGIVSHIQTLCIEQGIEYFAIPVGTVKKIATGRGNASKEDMLAACVREWPEVAIKDDNEADARWIAVAAMVHLGGA